MITAVACLMLAVVALLGVCCFASVASVDQIMAITSWLAKYSIKLVVTDAHFDARGELCVTWEARSRLLGEWALAVWCLIVGGTP